MAFFKDTIGFILFILCQLLFILQFFFIYELYDYIDNKPNTILTIHKTINLIFLFLTFYSHLKTSLIDPGSITIKNNRQAIHFYYCVHHSLIKAALYITEKKTPEVVKKLILGQKLKWRESNNENNKKEENEENLKKEENKENEENEKKEENKENENEKKESNEDEDEDDMSEKDYYPFEQKTSINEEMKKEIKDSYHMKLTRCKSCYVIRPLNTHHCSICHSCFFSQDHHCPWANNCIGLFNKKVFILFLIYSFIESIYSIILFFYYTVYKNIEVFETDAVIILLDLFSVIFGLILAIVSVMLLWDQYSNIRSCCTECDYKEGVLLERSSMKQQFQIIFGGVFSIKWLLPFFPGGNSDFFKELTTVLKVKKDKKENANEKMNDNDNNEKKEEKTDKTKKD